MQHFTPEYIIGLVDGEGSFTVYVRNPDSFKKVKRRVTVEPKFYVKLVEKDKEILYHLKEFFGCGSVYFQKDSRPNHQHCYRYEVYKREDILNIIIPFFKKNTLRFPSKRKDFATFCIMMNMIRHEEHLQKSGLKKLFSLKKTMH